MLFTASLLYWIALDGTVLSTLTVCFSVSHICTFSPTGINNSIPDSHISGLSMFTCSLTLLSASISRSSYDSWCKSLLFRCVLKGRQNRRQCWWCCKIQSSYQQSSAESQQARSKTYNTTVCCWSKLYRSAFMWMC